MIDLEMERLNGIADTTGKQGWVFEAKSDSAEPFSDSVAQGG